MQHDVYSWRILGKEFECLKEVTNGSKFIDKSIKEWLEQVDVEKNKNTNLCVKIYDIKIKRKKF